MKRWLFVLVLIGFGQAWAFHPNDVCSSALLLTIPTAGSMSTVGATTDPLNPCSDATPQNGVWFSVVGDGTTLRFLIAATTSPDRSLFKYSPVYAATTLTDWSAWEGMMIPIAGQIQHQPK